MLNLKQSLFLLIISTVFLFGCERFKIPYAISVTEFNEDPHQQPAAITVSDPQIYSRESLINDRLEEVKLLDKLLEDSRQPGFIDKFSEPQILRNLETVSTVLARARLSFNPQLGRDATRSDGLANQQFQNDSLRMEIQRQRLESIRDKQARGEELTDEEKGSLKVNNANTQNPPSDDPFTSIYARLDKLKDDLDKTIARVKVKKPQGSLSPTEKFRGLQAYRAVLRQARAEVNLDDLHGSNGNSLYRFQMKVGVFPGKDKGKMGILRLTFTPPELEDEDIEEIYFSWLNHMAFRLNQPFHSTYNKCPKPAKGYTQFMSSELFDIVQIPFPIENRDKPCTILIPIPPEFPSDSEDLEEKNEDKIIRYLKKVYLKATSNLKIRPRDQGESLQNLENELRDLVETCSIGLTEEPKGCSSGIVEKFVHRSGESFVPEKFKKIITEEVIEKDETTNIGGGRAYSYSTLPAKETQVSFTTGKSVYSMEAALSIAGSAATQGISGGGDFASFRRAAGAVEALETNPIIVGFASRYSAKAEQVKSCTWSFTPFKTFCPKVLKPFPNLDQLPQVGWVFGPRARLNPGKSEIQLIHSPEHHDVAADVSLPGWWPHVKIIAEKAWVGNWHNTGEMIRPTKNTVHGVVHDVFIRPLPQNISDLDALTEYIAKETFGSPLNLLSIREVQPYFLTACEDKVTLKILGAHIWRGTQVFLAGTEGENLQVLPDMEGVKVTFNLGKMLNTPNSLHNIAGFEQHLPLTVWTQNGSDSIPIPMKGTRFVKNGKAICKSATSFAQVQRNKHLAIVQTSPIEFPACTFVTLAVKLSQINMLAPEAEPTKAQFHLDGQAKVQFYLDGYEADKKSLDRIGWDNNKAIYKVTFDAKKILASQPSRTATLTATDGKNLASTPLRLLSCTKGTDEKKVSPPSPEPKLVKHYGNKDVESKESKESNKKLVTFDILIDPNKTSLDDPELVFSVRRVGQGGKKFATFYSWAPVKDGKIYKAGFKIDSKDSKGEFDNYYKGMPILEVARVKQDKDKKPAESKPIGNFVLYPHGENLSIELQTKEIKWVAKTKNLEEKTVTFQFFENATTAFPDLTKTPLVAFVVGTDITLDVVPPKFNIKDNKAAVSLQVGKENLIGFEAFLGKASNQKIEFRFKKLSKGSELPTFTGKLEIK